MLQVLCGGGRRRGEPAAADRGQRGPASTGPMVGVMPLVDHENSWSFPLCGSPPRHAGWGRSPDGVTVIVVLICITTGMRRSGQ